MNPRPLYRWKSFWLGVLVIAFLGWAWGWSMDRYFGGYLAARPARVGAVAIPGKISLSIRKTETSGIGYFYEKSDGWTPLPPALTWSAEWGGIKAAFAYWFLILLFLLAWSGWLAWRWRRIKRLDASRHEAVK